MKRARVLAFMHEHLVPPDSIEGLSEQGPQLYVGPYSSPGQVIGANSARGSIHVHPRVCLMPALQVGHRSRGHGSLPHGTDSLPPIR